MIFGMHDGLLPRHAKSYRPMWITKPVFSRTNMKEIYTEITINTNPDTVWETLINVRRYSEWNPLIRFVRGKLSPGELITIKIYLQDSKPKTFTVFVVKIIPCHTIQWSGHYIIPGLLDSQHIFELLDNLNGTTALIHRELYTGIFSVIVSMIMGNRIRRGFELMNTKLKEKCERPCM